MIFSDGTTRGMNLNTVYDLIKKFVELWKTWTLLEKDQMPFSTAGHPCMKYSSFDDKKLFALLLMP